MAARYDVGMNKIDVFKQHKDEYAMPKEPALVNVGAGRYLTVSGKGSPSGKEFREKVGALYGSAYTVKFAAKKERGRDFKVGMLEGLWWAGGNGKNALQMPKKTWRWKLLIRVPDFVTASALAKAAKALREKKKPAGPVKLETIREGKSVQTLHVGSYASEPKTIAKMDAFAKAKRLRFRGKHHEIYLSDPRRVAASRLRTILRHPVT